MNPTYIDSFLALLGPVLLAFAFGSMPTGYLVGKICGIDVRAHGSGNTGATNVSRVLGKKIGLFVLVIDMFKGILATQIAFFWPMESLIRGGALLPGIEELQAAFGLAALLGHCFSPFLRFKGGKGVATGLGVYFAVAPVQAMLGLSVFLLIFKATKYVSLSSIGGALAVPALMCMDRQPFSTVSVVLAACCSGVIILRHRANIVRLMNGTEPTYKSSKSVEASSPTVDASAAS